MRDPVGADAASMETKIPSAQCGRARTAGASFSGQSVVDAAKCTKTRVPGVEAFLRARRGLTRTRLGCNSGRARRGGWRSEENKADNATVAATANDATRIGEEMASEDKKKTAYPLFLDCSGQFRLDVPLACLEVLHACQFLLSPCSQACRRAKPSRTLQQQWVSTMQKMRGCVTSSRVKASPTVSPRWTSRTSNGTSSLSFRSWSLGGTSCGCSEAARIQTGGSVAPSLQHEKDDAVWPLPETGRHR